MSYLRCTNPDCLEVVDMEGTVLGELLDRAEKGCLECGQPVLGIFAGSPTDAATPSGASGAISNRSTFAPGEVA